MHGGSVPAAAATSTVTTTTPTNATVTKATTKLPTGVVTKPNTTGYEVIKPNMAQGKKYLHPPISHTRNL